MIHHRCPSCGGQLELFTGAATLSTCPACGTTHVQDGATRISILTRTEAGDLARGSDVELTREFGSRYRLSRMLGAGAMGTVYLAQQLSTRRSVAVKFLIRADEPTTLARFLSEGRLLARISHPNVVKVYDVGQIGKHPYQVTEYVDGGTLRELMKKKGRLEVTAAARLVQECLAGLEACHQAGIVHRDLKPENILLSSSGDAKVADLGIARTLSGDQVATRAGALIGTPRYMSPEQIRGEVAGIGADLYSMGLILYEVLTGQYPFPAATLPELLSQQLTAAAGSMRAHVPEIPEALDRLVRGALAKRVEDRPVSAGLFAKALKEATSERPSRPRRATRSERARTGPIAAVARSGPRRSRTLVVAGALVACLLPVILVRTGENPPGPGPTRLTIPPGSPGGDPSGAPSTRPSRPASQDPGPPPSGASSRSSGGAREWLHGLVPLGAGANGLERYRSEKDGAVMVRIPAGSFPMGAADGRPDEAPVHSVHLDAFLIDEHEVTNRRYRQFAAATGHRRPRELLEPRFNRDDQPVVGVSWDDAVSYCRWAGKRLPTEAEWEKAARGGLEGKSYPWGNDAPAGRACFGETFSSGRAKAIGSYPANGYGLFDMAGNAWEWCSDRYGERYYAASPTRNPAGPSSGASRVVRGGSWFNYDARLRCAYRRDRPPTDQADSLGFRCARSLSP
ncbi:MAG: SUMF1/EgtB/PvdO family nonheme iron enzyme [Candidatus Riflebacteria bacterium]|nr:SUMF1/EgtB/PvdO family nonheme iron enzyme [Candidatus Riflebacteria bacterium]